MRFIGGGSPLSKSQPQRNMSEKRPKTIILDIDGCILQHHNSTLSDQVSKTMKLLPAVREKFNEWDYKGYRIILLTGRKESMRKETEEQLKYWHLFWDQLIMGVGGGVRVLINDLKPDGDEPTAVAINLKRNEGLEEVDI